MMNGKVISKMQLLDCVPDSTSPEETPKKCGQVANFSRIVWRKLKKRERRRAQRQKRAKERAQEEAEELAELMKDPGYVTRLADQDALELCRLEEDKRVSVENHKAWLEREQVAQFEFEKKQKKRREIEAKAQEERDKIKREFEDAERKRQMIKEQKRKAEEEILRNHQMKLEEIRNYIEGIITDVPESLLGTTDTNPSAQECQYFRKTSVCRFGERCLRNHIKSKLSSVLLIPNFFGTENFLRGFTLTKSEEIIQNSLEVNREFNEFFEDVCAEFEKFGAIQNVVVCSNSEKHMMGNTFVEYSVAKSALAACYQLNGRFYGGQKLQMDFCHNLNWRTAVCGLSLNNKCSRGSSCNYLHIFRNPGGKYPMNMNTLQSLSTPSPAVNSLNGNTVEMRTSWNDGEREVPPRKHWRWSASPEPKKNNEENPKEPIKEPRGEKSKEIKPAGNPETIRTESSTKRLSRSPSRTNSYTRRSSSPSRDRNTHRKYSKKKSHKNKEKKRKRSRSRSRKRSRSRSRGRKHSSRSKRNRSRDRS